MYGAARADMYAPAPRCPLNDAYEKYEQYTQELRVTSPADATVTYVAGLYFFYKDFTDNFTRYIDLYGIDFAPEPNSGALSVLNDTDASNQSAAVFGQVTWNVTDISRLVLGARYNDDQLTHKQTVSAIPGTLPEAPPGSVDAKTDDQGGSWRVIGEHDIAQDAMVYASVARGYKGPGSNSLPSGPTSGDVFVDPEIPTSYEVGIKSQWLDNRLRLNGAAYYSTFKDFQASAQVAGAFPPLFYLTNAGELETQGVEIEVNANVLENFDVQASLAYTDAIFSDWDDAPCYAQQTAAQGCVNGVQDLSGADMPFSPDWAMFLAGTYYIPLPSQPFDGFASLNFFWRDEVQFDTANNPLLTGDPYNTFDLYTGSGGARWPLPRAVLRAEPVRPVLPVGHWRPGSGRCRGGADPRIHLQAPLRRVTADGLVSRRMAKEYWYFVSGVLVVLVPLLLLVAVKKLHLLEVRPDQKIVYSRQRQRKTEHCMPSRRSTAPALHPHLPCCCFTAADGCMAARKSSIPSASIFPRRVSAVFPHNTASGQTTNLMCAAQWPTRAPRSIT